MFTKTDIEKYFIGEKQESLLFIFIGIAGVVLALVFLIFLKTNFYKGAAIPLIAIGLLLSIIGYTVYKRSDGDRKNNVYAYDMNPSQLRDQELPRMKKVMKNFVLYRYVEIILALTGLFLFLYFRNDAANSFWKGFGIALGIMAIVAIFADYFAEKRGSIYTKGIESFIKNK